jgi:8-oxo-dGTP diphosphatase
MQAGESMQKVTVAVFERRGKILLALRKPGRHMGRKWELPGGKIKPGETPRDCLERELAEEFSITVRVGAFIGSACYSSDQVQLELHAYRVAQTGGRFELREHEELRWVDKEEIAGYDLVESDRSILAMILSAV